MTRRVLTAGFHLDLFLETIRRADDRFLALGALLTVLSYWIRAVRWHVMAKPQKANLSLWRIFRATAVGYTAILILGRPGELVRPYLIADREGLPLSSQLAAWALERIYDLLVLLLAFAFAVVGVTRSGALAGTTLGAAVTMSGWAVATLSLVCLAVLFALHWFADSLEERILRAMSFLEAHHQARIASHLKATLSGLRSTHDLPTIFLLTFYSFLEWSLLAAVYAAVCLAFPETRNFTLSTVVVLLGVTSLAGIVQIPGVGGGMQLASTLALTELFQLSLEAATGITVVLWVTNFLVIVPFGVFFAFRLGLNWRTLRHLPETENRDERL